MCSLSHCLVHLQVRGEGSGCLHTGRSSSSTPLQCNSSWIWWISPSSISHFFPSWHFPSNSCCGAVISQVQVTCHALTMSLPSDLEPLLYRSMVLFRSLQNGCMYALPSCTLVKIEISRGSKGLSWCMVRSQIFSVPLQLS